MPAAPELTYQTPHSPDEQLTFDVGQVLPKLKGLGGLPATCIYLQLTTAAMRHAAELWTDARARGFCTAPATSLDADVFLAAQALAVGGTVVTTNPRHLDRFVAATAWEELSGA